MLGMRRSSSGCRREGGEANVAGSDGLHGWEISKSSPWALGSMPLDGVSPPAATILLAA
jgi:hypothetical protein